MPSFLRKGAKPGHLNYILWKFGWVFLIAQGLGALAFAVTARTPTTGNLISGLVPASLTQLLIVLPVSVIMAIAGAAFPDLDLKSKSTSISKMGAVWGTCLVFGTGIGLILVFGHWQDLLFGIPKLATSILLVGALVVALRLYLKATYNSRARDSSGAIRFELHRSKLTHTLKGVQSVSFWLWLCLSGAWVIPIYAVLLMGHIHGFSFSLLFLLLKQHVWFQLKWGTFFLLPFLGGILNHIWWDYSSSNTPGARFHVAKIGIAENCTWGLFLVCIMDTYLQGALGLGILSFLSTAIPFLR